MAQEILTRSGSRYELDTASSRIRRMGGTHAATSRQGADGEWRSYEEVSPVAVGEALVVVWRTNADGVAECTITTPVESIVSLS